MYFHLLLLTQPLSLRFLGKRKRRTHPVCVRDAKFELLGDDPIVDSIESGLVDAQLGADPSALPTSLSLPRSGRRLAASSRQAFPDFLCHFSLHFSIVSVRVEHENGVGEKVDLLHIQEIPIVSRVLLYVQLSELIENTIQLLSFTGRNELPKDKPESSIDAPGSYIESRHEAP